MIDTEFNVEAMKRKLDLMEKMMECMAKTPLYYRCSEKTWADIQRAYPPKSIDLPHCVLRGVEIRVYEDCPYGFHPVFKETAK